MADSESTSEVGIKSVSDNTGFEDAKRGMKETEDAARNLGGAAKELGYDIEKLKEALVELVAFAEVLAFFKEAAEAAYDHEKALRAVAQAAVVSGQNMDEAKKAADEYTQALALQTGVVRDQLLEAYGKFLLATSNQEEAQSRLEIAANIASTGLTSLSGAYRLVQGAANGTTGAFQKMLGVHIQGATNAEKSANAIAYLEKNYRNVQKATNDAAMEQDRANRRWEEFKENIGGPVLAAMNGLRNGIVLAKDAVILMGKEVVEWFDTMGKSVGAFASFVKNVFTGSGSLQSEYAKYKAETDRIDKEHAERSLKIEEESVKKYVDLEGKKLDDKKKKMASDAEDEKKVEKDGLDWYGHIIKEREKVALTHQKFLDELTKRKDADDKREEDEMYARIARENKAIEQKLDVQTRALKQAAEEQAKISEALAKYKVDLETTVVNNGLSLAGDAFGIRKELAMAEAVVAGAQAFIEALAAPYPMDIVLPALIAALTAEQIATISSQSSPSMSGSAGAQVAGLGFDDPSHDAAAFMGGRKWADDMIGKFSAGVTAGWSSGMASAGGSTSQSFHYDMRRTTNVTGVGIVDASHTEMLKKLKRGLDQVDQNAIGPTTVGRAPRR